MLYFQGASINLWWDSEIALLKMMVHFDLESVSGRSDRAIAFEPLAPDVLQKDPDLEFLRISSFRTTLMLPNLAHRPFDKLSARRGLVRGAGYTVELRSVIDREKELRLGVKVKHMTYVLPQNLECDKVIVDIFLVGVVMGAVAFENVELEWSGFEPVLVFKNQELARLLHDYLDFPSAEEVAFLWTKDISSLYIMQGSKGPVAMRRDFGM